MTPAPQSAPRVMSAPSAERSFSRQEGISRSAPVTTVTPRSAPVAEAPRVMSAPNAERSFSRQEGSARTSPTYTAPRVSAEGSSRFPSVSTSRQTPSGQQEVARPVTTPRAQNAEHSVSPRFSPQTENARGFGTARSASPVAETPAAQAPSRSFLERGNQGVSRSDQNAARDTGRHGEAVRPLAPSTREPVTEQGATARSVGRTPSFSRDTSVGRSASPRLDSGTSRLNPPTTPSSISPMRFGTPSQRGVTSRDEHTSLPSALSLRSPRGDAGTDRFGRSAIPRRSPGSPEGAALPRAGIPAGVRSGPHPYANDTAIYRPPYGGADHHNYHPSPHPSHCPPPPHHFDGHHDHHPYWHHPYACSPVWWGPVIYPAGFGLTWYSGDFALSIATYAPAYTYTRYYDSWHCGGWGYTGVYYGGWRSGWYGGFSYVYNPWPVYRTYYLYDPYPAQTVYVTQPAETVYVSQPASTTVYVNQPATTTVVSDQPAPTTTAYAATPTAYAASPANTAPYAASSSAWDAAPAVERSETAATTCFCPCRCNGQRPCTCSYPCGAEYALRDEDLDLSSGFASYADTMSPEIIWSSYAGLDRWATHSETYDKGSIATLDDGSL